MVPNSRVGSGYCSDPESNSCNRSYHMKLQTVAIGLVLPLNTQHFNTTRLPPIKYLSSDRIMRQSICRLCSLVGSITSRNQICDRTHIRWVAIENPRNSREIGCCLTSILCILIGLQFWTREEKERIKLHNLHIDHITIWSKLKYLFEAKGVGTIYLKLESSSNPAKHPAFYIRSG